MHHLRHTEVVVVVVVLQFSAPPSLHPSMHPSIHLIAPMITNTCVLFKDLSCLFNSPIFHNRKITFLPCKLRGEACSSRSNGLHQTKCLFGDLPTKSQMSGENQAKPVSLILSAEPQIHSDRDTNTILPQNNTGPRLLKRLPKRCPIIIHEGQEPQGAATKQ